MYTDEQKKWAGSFLSKCEKKVYSVMDDVERDCPMGIPPSGKNYDEWKASQYNWTSGFWGGIMWLLYSKTGKEKYKNRAIKCSERMQGCLGNNEEYGSLNNHDLGFTFGLTSVAHYKFLGDNDAKIRGLHAATMIAGRYNINGGFIVAWDKNETMGDDVSGYSIMDTMMNLPLLYWATEETNEPRFAQIAMAHADMVSEKFVKPDGSVYHIVDFDPWTGVVRGYPQGQGYASGSSWSRGQAWAVYGFMLSYLHTKKEKYLEVACHVADYIIENMGDFTIAPVDYMQPEEPKLVDASASAITACGMLEISKAMGDKGKKYLDFAIKLLEGLFDDCDFGDKNQAIVQNAMEMYGRGTNVPLIYADYYLIEALLKITDDGKPFMW